MSYTAHHCSRSRQQRIVRVVARVLSVFLVAGMVYTDLSPYGVQTVPRAYAAPITIYITDTASTTWRVPADWNSSNNKIEIIGGGAGGGAGLGANNRAGSGGGGGAYASTSNVTLTPSTDVGIRIGTGGGSATAGGGSWFCNSTTNCASIAGSAVVVGGNGGATGVSTTGGPGGTVAVGTGYAGGDGGNGTNSNNTRAGGGGGAGGPLGAGLAGIGDNAASVPGGDGGGGVGNSGGAGGASASGTGGDGTEFSANPYGSGGGGGGATAANAAGGDAGNYGGGGGGGRGTGAGGVGMQGIIVITYTPADTTAPTPSPAYFTSAPAPISDVAVSMTSVTATDDNAVSYYFTATTSSCGVNVGTGGTDSGWQSGTTYSDTGLQANKCYGYMVTARDDQGNSGATSTASTTYTLAAQPSAPTLASVATSTLVLTNNEGTNPTANPSTSFTIYVSGTSPNDATWEGRYVASDGTANASPQWLSDTQLTSLTVTGLQASTSYSFVSVARNQNNINAATSTSAATSTLNPAPTPSPQTFSSAPSGVSTTSVTMTATAATSINGTVQYYFAVDNSTCGVNAGTGGTDSGWQTSTSYTDTGLQVNRCYGYKVYAREPYGRTNATSSISTTYTLAATPTAPTLTTVTGSTLVLTNNEGTNPTANPSTSFTIYVSGTSPNDATWEGRYVASDGTPNASPQWLSDSQLTSLTVTGLTGNTSYNFYAVARNQNNINSGTSTATATTTLDATIPSPNPPYFSTSPTPASTSSITMTSVTVTDIATPVEYYFAATSSTCGANYGTGATDSGWQTSASYTDTGLQANKCYGYTITARDAVGNKTSTSTASTTYTLAATPTAPTLASVGTSTLVLTNNENGNPASNPTTDFTVYVSGTSPNHATWEGKYVNASGAPSDTPVWLTDAQLTSLTITGLTYNTSYSFYAQARNANSVLSGTSTAAATTTLPDTTAPAPAPIFATTPAPATVSSITMTTTVASDDNGPVEYYFALDNTACGANAGTGGTDSAWQSATSYTDSGLDANKCYGYKVYARDALGNPTATSTASTTYTLAATPTAPTLASVGTSTLVLTNNENGNPASNPTTNFTVYVDLTSPNDATWDGQYVDATGNPSATPVLLTDAQLTTLTINDLNPSTAYSFYAQARNQNSVLSGTSSPSATTTLEADPPTPDPAYFTSSPTPVSTTSITMTSVTVTDATGPVEYSFTLNNTACGANAGTGGTSSGWQSSASYTDTGLDVNKCYGYTIQTRDAIGTVSTASAASTTYTHAATPTAPTLSSVGTSTLVLTNNENGNPASNPATEFTVYVDSSSPSDTNWEGKYVASDGTANAVPQWLTDAQIDGLTVIGLTPNTSYTFYSTARNGDSVPSGTSTGTTTTTSALGGDLIPSISSADNQQFYVGQATATLEIITITEAVSPGITSTNNIRITIATTTTNFRFDTDVTTPTFGGTASSKVASTVTYEDQGATVVIDVTSNFASIETLTIAGLEAGSFASVSSAVSNLELHTDGNTTGAPADSDDKTIRITGAVTLGDHSAGQVTNQFVFLSNGADTPLFAFELAPAGENATTSSLQIDLSGVANIDTDKIQNIRLYRDHDGDKGLSVGDEQIGGTGALTVTGATGTIVFSTEFLATTTQDYVMISDISDVYYANRMTLELTTSGLTVTGVTSGVEPVLLGSISTIEHRKGMPPQTGGTGDGGGNIGDAAPGGTVMYSGGGGGGGGRQSAVGDETVDDGGGETIGNEPGFYAPADTGDLFNAWTNGSNAYSSNAAYATSSTANQQQSYSVFSFGIPGTNSITGIAVKLEARGSTAAGSIDVDLSWNNGGSWTSTKSTGALTASDVVYELGGQGDTWEHGWVPAELADGTFHVRLTSQASSNEVRVDALQVAIFHQTTGGGGGAGGEILGASTSKVAGLDRWVWDMLHLIVAMGE